MRKFSVLIIILVGLSTLTNAQISDSYILTPNDITVLQNEIYDVISIEGCSYTDEVGKPQLPVFMETFVLPYSSIVTDVQVTTTSRQQIAGNYYIFPTQPPRVLDGSDPPPFVEPDQVVYSSNTPYPNKTVEIVDDGYLYGYHVVTVKIYPVSYIPASGEIYLQSYDFTINYTISSRNNSGEKAQQSDRRAELTKQFVQGIVKNSNNVENYRNQNVQIVSNIGTQYVTDTTRGGTTSAIDILVPDYIIITNNELKPTFKTLADWKTKKNITFANY